MEGEAPAEPSPHTAPPLAPLLTEELDSLPAVGKVFDGEKRSLGAIFASSRGHQPRAVPRDAQPAACVAQGEFAPVMQKLVTAMREHGSGYDGILVHGQIIALANGRATIRYNHQHEASARMLERHGKRETVQRVLSGLLNEPVSLTIEVEPEPPEAAVAPPAPARGLQPHMAARVGQEPPSPAPQPAAPPLTPEQKQRIVDTDPLVRSAIELFGGEIVKAD